MRCDHINNKECNALIKVVHFELFRISLNITTNYHVFYLIFFLNQQKDVIMEVFP